MADNNLLKEKVQILEQMKLIQADQGKDAAKLDASYIKLKGRLEGIVKVLKGFVDVQNSTIQGAVDLEKEAKSLGTIYNGISGKMKQQAIIQKDIAGGIKTELENGKALTTTKGNQQQIVSSLLSKYNDQSIAAKQIAELTADDVVAKQQLEDKISSIADKIKEEVSSLDKRTNIAKQFLSNQDSIAASIDDQLKKAKDLASLEAEQKDILEQQAEVFVSMKKKVGALGSTLTTFLKRPQAAIGALVIGIGKFAGKFGEVNRELGQSFTQGLNASTLSATGLGFIFEDTAGTVRELASEFGGVDAATLSTQANIGLIAQNMGISNKEAVGLTASFTRLNGGSSDMAANMIATTQEFANQNGIIPAALMQDLAGSAEQFALFGKDGGKNILRAAGYAQKLGVNMATLSGISEGLLDFETSITKELELGAMLGKNINLDRARALAYEGDIEGATKETLRALGGIDAFNKMDYFQKKASADLLGISVAEMQKMADNQGKANELGSIMNTQFSKMGEFLNGGLNKWLGTSIQGLGGMITMTGQVGMGFTAMGTSIGGVVKGTGRILKNMLSMGSGTVLKGLKAAGGFLANTGIGKKVGGIKDKLLGGLKSKVATPGGSEPPGGGMLKSIGKIDMTKVLKGAAAMVIVAGAVFILGKAVQEFKDVGIEQMGMVGLGILGLAAAVMAVGFGGPLMIVGAAAMLIVAASVLVLGYALQAIGTGFTMMGDGIGNLIPHLTSVASTVGGLITLIPALALLSVAFFGLAASIMAVGVAGALSLPGIMAVAGVGMIASGVGSLLGIGGDSAESGKDSALINEIKGLRDDLIGGKIGVYMDGEKVTSKISNIVERSSTNSYAIG